MHDSYDYVIVGAGSAGAVIASRLTEDPSLSVLLLEAGAEPTADEIGIPAAFSTLFKTKWDWHYNTVEQKQLESRRAYWPRMRALGGCSSMNAMIYIRGNRLDYDTWRDEFGADGWGYDDVLPYFVRAENNTTLGGPYHGQGGPLWVEDRRYNHPLTFAWLAIGRRERHEAQRRLQRRRAGRGGALPGHVPQGPSLVHLRRLPGAGDGPAQPDRPDRRARHPGRGRERPRRRRRVPGRPRRAGRPRGGGGHPLRRCGELAAAAAALGHRPRLAPAGGRSRRRRGPAGCGGEPPRPPGGADGLAHPGHQ